MSINAVLEQINAEVEENFVEEIEVQAAVVIEEETTVTNVVKRGKGRPGIHPFQGRTYLLKNELKMAMEDKHSFVKLMNETYALSPERKEELGKIANAPSELSFTVHGPILTVIEQLHKLRGLYGDKAKINISKERMVAPTSKLYMQPIQEIIGQRNGKNIVKRIFEEYRADTVYGYVTVTL